jgi:hypothetical protein
MVANAAVGNSPTAGWTGFLGRVLGGGERTGPVGRAGSANAAIGSAFGSTAARDRAYGGGFGGGGFGGGGISGGGFGGGVEGGGSGRGDHQGGYARGGVLPQVPWFERRNAYEMQHDHGLFHSAVPGRTDRINASVPAGSYVIPADVVSGLGEGNTLAGANVLHRMMATGPYGTPLSRGRGRNLPAPRMRPPRFERGGRVPIVAAGGEFLVHPDVVKRIGKGDLTRGHEALDAFVKRIRARTASTLRKLPGPKK